MATGIFLQLDKFNETDKTYQLLQTNIASIETSKIDPALDKGVKIVITIEAPLGIYQDSEISEDDVRKICDPLFQPEEPLGKPHIFLQFTEPNVIGNAQGLFSTALQQTQKDDPVSLTLKFDVLVGKVNGSLG